MSAGACLAAWLVVGALLWIGLFAVILNLLAGA